MFKIISINQIRQEKEVMFKGQRYLRSCDSLVKLESTKGEEKTI